MVVKEVSDMKVKENKMIYGWKTRFKREAAEKQALSILLKNYFVPIIWEGRKTLK